MNTIANHLSVSIPFKREGAWKVESSQPADTADSVSIPFKREGAWKVVDDPTADDDIISFNSLQTGRSMERTVNTSTAPLIRVSIPFKREGAWKVILVATLEKKAKPVSIPFKREGAWKVFHIFLTVQNVEQKFQFPSNGKEHGKKTTGEKILLAAHLFQFPSNGKEHGKNDFERMKRGAQSFNSLQTGRSMESKRTVSASHTSAEYVSIPFKREGAWKEIRVESFSAIERCFNSLQTGRSMERSWMYTTTTTGAYIRFNSLQTGRSMERRWDCFRCLPHVWVSIPFKREGAWKETLFSTQTGRGSKHPKTKHELRWAFFTQKITPKFPQTLVAIEPNAIFQQKQLGTHAYTMFVGIFKHICIRSRNRVCFCNSTRNS